MNGTRNGRMRDFNTRIEFEPIGDITIAITMRIEVDNLSAKGIEARAFLLRKLTLFYDEICLLKQLITHV
jgi:hypothetical protein